MLNLSSLVFSMLFMPVKGSTRHASLQSTALQSAGGKQLNRSQRVTPSVINAPYIKCNFALLFSCGAGFGQHVFFAFVFFLFAC
jgi:hypothetical protein